MNIDWRGSQDASRCPLLNPDADLDTIISHNILFCDRCRDEQILEKTKGKEILFPRGPPSWITSSENNSTWGKEVEGECFSSLEENELTVQKKCKIGQENSNNQELCARNEKFKSGGKRKREMKGEKPGTSSSTNISCSAKHEPEKSKASLPTGIELHRLAKQGYSKEEALQKYVERQREKAKPKMEDNKVQISPQDMPWAPPCPKFFKNRRSAIPKAIDHQRYVAIVANFLNANNPQPRFQQNRQEVRVMDEKLADERMKYQQIVLNSLLSRKRSIYACENRQIRSYIVGRLKARASSLQYHFGAPIYDEEMKDLADDPLNVLSKKTVIHQGKVPKIILPNERRRFSFNCTIDDISTQYPLSETDKCPIESDEFAMHLAVKHGVRTVMCSSAALKILCNPWVGDSSTYLIPVVVKQTFSDRTNRFENVCLVGKPCVEKTIDGPSSWRRYVKLAVKMELYGNLKRETAKKPVKAGGRQRAKVLVKVAQNDKNNKTRTKHTVDHDAAEKTNLIIANTMEESDSGQGSKTPGALSSSLTSCRGCDDILGDIMSDMSNNDLAKNYLDMGQNFDHSKFSDVNLSKRYAVFSLGQEGVQDINIIIRANNDGIDSSGNELALAFKIEYAPEFGAERLNDEEFLSDYFRCKLKGASQLVRLRIHGTALHLLQKERYNENMLTTNKPNLRKLAEERTDWLRKVIVKLESLEANNYLIRKSANRLQILPSVDDIKSAYVREEQLKELCYDEQLPSAKVFRGIDEHLVLVYHIVQKRIPASFGPMKNRFLKNSENDHNYHDAHGKQSTETYDNSVPTAKSVARESTSNRRKRHGRKRKRRNCPKDSGTSPSAKNFRFRDLDAPAES